MRKINELATLGDSLREERKLLGMTQKEAAAQFKISLKALRNLEQGYGGVTLTTAAQIFEYLGKQLRVGDIISVNVATPPRKHHKNEILETLRLVRPVLEKKFNVKRVTLFGSFARDEAKKNSDIDLAVQFTEPPNFSVLGRLTLFIESLFEGRKVDLVEYSRMKKEVRDNAKKDFIHV